MKKNILIAMSIGITTVIFAFLVVFGSSLKNLKQEVIDSTTIESTTPQDTMLTNSPEGITSDASANLDEVGNNGYTLTDIAIHNSASSCWSVINRDVYDLTSWVNSHPGGKAAILMICGKDGTPLFNSQHSGQKKPANILLKFKIGELK
jgi:cytochrome b involved in lipid metabolism